MVLGLRSKSRRDTSLKLDYIICLREIRPWPPSESLRRVRRLLLQWANGTKSSGTFLSTAIAEGSNVVVFNESFKLPVTLQRDKKSHDKFQRNHLEFSVFESRKDKAKGQLLGAALVNLADYGVIDDVINVSAPVNLKKSSNSNLQPFLVISLEPVQRESSTSSPSVGLSKEPSLNNDDDDVSEIASFTDDDDDDDVSPHSSISSTFQNQRENAQLDPDQSSNTQPLSTDAYIPSGSSEEYVRDTRAVDNYQETAESSNPVDSLYTNAFQEKILQPEAVLVNGDKLVKKLPENSASETETSRIMTIQEGTLISNSASTDHTNSLEMHNSVDGNQIQSEVHIAPNIQDSNLSLISKNGLSIEATDEKVAQAEKISDSNNDELRTRIETLENELRETAAIEVALYSVAAEHSSSANKVHAPARRLARFYVIACKSGSEAKRASAARAVVSGLVLVSKACGNDVPRLTFWLSNFIMLRSIISQTSTEFHNSGSNEESDDSDDVRTFIMALEKIESWLFSRIVESLWWQTFTPHMQPSVAKESVKTPNEATKKKTYGRRVSLGNQEQGNFSIELWNKAFRDACEKLCPIRAGGHECGCLSVLVRLVMEQLVDRLDMAMFNAVLRESDEEMPTDPLSDPISDSRVLPIAAGKSSFGAGVELKNAIGCWSRQLTDLFGLEDDSTEAFRAFRLLHALADLMMIPFGMLADVPTRKDVCPSFGPMIVKRVLSNFVPDEFCPNQVPRAIIDSLDTEAVLDDSEYLLTTLPCTASTPTKYSPPSAALLVCVGEVGSQVLQSSRLSFKKAYTSDDELDELDSPLTSIIPDGFLQSSSALVRLSSMPRGGTNVVRYQLLREIWKDDE